MRGGGKTKIIYKFLAFSLPLLFLSVLLTSTVLTWTNYTYFRRTIRSNYQHILTASAGEIRLFIHNARQGIEALALQTTAVKADPWQQEMLLAAFLQVNTQFEGIALMSPDGRPGVGVAWDLEALSEDKKTLQAAAAGHSIVSEVRFTDDGLPHAHVAVPVRHLGQISAILVADLNLKAVWDVLESIHIGDTGQVYILDPSGRPVAHKEMDRVVTRSLMAAQGTLRLLSEVDHPVQWIEKKQTGRPSIFCLGKRLPELDWIIVLSQELPETYRQFYQNILWSGIIAAVIALLATLLGWKRVSRLLVPLQALHRQVGRFSRGKLDQKIAIENLGRRQDEIGELGLAFNRMAVDLQAYISRELETTRELAHTRNLAVLGTTFSKVTHEMGNYFNNLEMVLGTIKREPLSSGGTKILAILEKDTQRTQAFIRNYLQFSKKPQPHLSTIPLDRLIREVWDSFQAGANRQGIHFELKWPGDIPPLEIDPALMHQVFTNLIKNSFEAMWGPGRIKISGFREDGHLRATLEDSGPGLSEQAREHIFDPFFTTKGAKGTGLGMAIVKTFVEAHQATIDCPPNPGKGALFVIHIPWKAPFDEVDTIGPKP